MPHFRWLRALGGTGPGRGCATALKSEFLIAITQLAAERSLPREVVLGAVEAALISAFKKDHLAELDLAVRISASTGDVHVFAKRTVVEEGAVTDPKTQVGLLEARGKKADAEVGVVLEEEVTPANAGRIAAQTAKQVVLQRLREAERELVYSEYAGKEGELVSGVVQRYEGRAMVLDLGRAEAVLPPTEQVAHERYRPGMRLKVLVLEVGKSAKGPQIVVSRTHKNLIKRLFELEVPEIHSGIVEIKAIAREAGFRSKVAVAALQDRVDPVGSCVGLRGIRIQNVVNELHGEKIDVLEWSGEARLFIARALSPAQVTAVVVRAESHTAIVVVPDRQLSLAIGREGQNARLAAKLTGWRIDIKSSSEAEAQKLEPEPVGSREGGAPAEIAERARAAAAAIVPPPPPIEVPPAAGEGEPAEGEAEEIEAAPVGAAGPVEEAPTLAEALTKEETWKVPVAGPPGPPKSAIRFAEDILERPGRGGGKRKGKDREEERAKRPKRPMDLVYEEEDEGDEQKEKETEGQG